MHDAMRIGLVVSSSVDGGGETYLRSLYEGLARRGHDIVLFGELPRWSLASIDTGVTGKWRKAGASRHLRTMLSERERILHAVRKEHERVPFDIFHLQYKREQILVTWPLARLAPVLWTEHGKLPSSRGSLLLKVAYRWAAQRASMIVCVSDTVRDDIRRWMPRSLTAVVVRNSVNLTRYRPCTEREREDARRTLCIPSKSLVVVTVSRLHRDKGIDLAIAAVDHLPETAILVVAGDGPDLSRLQELARGRGVVFTGHLDDVRLALRAADVFLFSSRPVAGEGSPTAALLEAAAQALPIVATVGSGVEREVTSAGGTIARPDPVAVAKVLRSIDIVTAGCLSRTWAEAFGLIPWLDRHEQIATRAISKYAQANR